MSRMATLVFLAASVVPQPPSRPGLSATQAMANYRAMLDKAATEAPACPPGFDGEIVVCHRDARPVPRLPMPDVRAEAGEVVHHLGEPPKGDPGAPTGPPSRQMETVVKLFGLLKGAVTGEDDGN